MTKKLGIGAIVIALAAVVVLGSARRGETQAKPGKSLVLAIYTPTVAFANSAARLAYVQRLAKAISSAAGTKVLGRSFTSITSLKRAKPDFAIVAAQCVAANPKWPLLANAKVGGKQARRWALYSAAGPSLGALRGKKLVYVKTGCRDEAYTFNAMFETEVGKKFFGGLVNKPDVSGAVAEVASYKGAHAVFAPAGTQKGLTKVFDSGAVPAPALVQLNSSLDKALVKKVEKAVTGYGGGGAISGWSASDRGPFNGLLGRMRKRVKRPTFATPSPVRVDSRDVLINPRTLDDPMHTEVDQHFGKPPKRH